MTENHVIKGKSVSAEEKAEYDSLRVVFDPTSGMQRLDSYSKWLFGSSAVIASLGAGLSNAAFSKLRGPGVLCFAVAIVALTVCLIAVALSVAPKWENANIYDLAQLRDAVAKQFKSRRWLLGVAGVSFPIALALAGSSPLLSVTARPSLVVHFSAVEPGKPEVGLEARGLKPGTVASLCIESKPGSKCSHPIASSYADDTGHVQLTPRVANPSSSSGTFELVGCLSSTPDTTKCFAERRLLLPM